MKDIKFRTLTAAEIEVRPTDTKTKGKATLLLYQTARCPMEILDETFPGAWCSDFKEVAGDVYCGIGIKIEDEWIWRWNAGAEGTVGEGKSTASDAFKRAATMWGIGRELYYTPRIRIQVPDDYYFNDKMTMSFTVQKIEFNDKRECTALVVVDRFGKVVYDMGQKVKMSASKPKTNEEILKDFCSAKKHEEGTDVDDLLRFYEFFIKKLPDWKGQFKVDVLYTRWKETKRS